MQYTTFKTCKVHSLYITFDLVKPKGRQNGSRTLYTVLWSNFNLKLGSDHLARTTPGGSEINHYELVSSAGESMSKVIHTNAFCS